MLAWPSKILTQDAKKSGVPLEAVDTVGAGRQYLTQEAIDEFQRRAISGEFAQEHRVPYRAA